MTVITDAHRTFITYLTEYFVTCVKHSLEQTAEDVMFCLCIYVLIVVHWIYDIHITQIGDVYQNTVRW